MPKNKMNEFFGSSRLQNKKGILLFLLCIFMYPLGTLANVGDGWVVRVRHSGDESTLGARGFTIERSLDSQHRVFKVRAKSLTSLQNFVALDLNRRESDSVRVSSLLSNLSDIEIAEPNYIYRASSGARRPQPSRDDLNTPSKPDLTFQEIIPNDPYFQALWGLRNRGQTVNLGVRGTSGADTRSTGAWVYEKGSEQIVVGVLDTGIDLTHEDLKDNLWNDPTTSGRHGYNTIDHAKTPQDDNGHGTHVSGTIGAVGDNGIGVSGINWKVSLMAVKVLDKDGSGDISTIVEGIDWAVQHGARVLNASWGGGGSSQIMSDAISRANTAGVLFVAAAGNDGENNDNVASYPANYALPNIISVAATDNGDQLASFSNFGTHKVHIAAPGVSIYSTLPGNKYGAESGTSMATPHVTGAAALKLARSPNLSVSELKAKILSTADHLSGLKSKVGNNGARLNLLTLIK